MHCLILPSRSKSVLLSHGTPYRNLIVSTWDPHSIKHHLVRAHLKQPVTHVRARFTDRKTMVYDPVRCGSMPAAYSQYPAALLLFLTTAQTNWSLWDFVELFCTYCDLKLCRLFSKNCKAISNFSAGYFCNIIVITYANCKSGYWKILKQHILIWQECDLYANWDYMSLRKRHI